MNAYLEQCRHDFHVLASASAEGSLQRFRQTEWQRFESLGWPSVHLENWKYTSLSALEKLSGLDSSQTAGVPDEPDEFVVAESRDRVRGLKITWVDGQPDWGHCDFSQLPAGVHVQFWSTLSEEEKCHFADRLSAARHLTALGALNGALLSEGISIRVDRGVRVAQPIMIEHYGRQGGSSQVALLVEMGEDAELTLWERWQGNHDEPCYVNGVTALHMADRAQLTWVKLLQEGGQTYHTAALWAGLGSHSRLRLYPLALAGAFGRHDIHVVLQKPMAECVLRGVYRVAEREFQDFHTCLEHQVPQCQSDECFKGVIDGMGKAVFNGRVRVAQDAQKTQSRLANHNILLSEKAEINTKPELEIFADDVRCSHGTTVGQLDENQWFYLRSRGIESEQARRLLIGAFTREITESIPHADIRRALGRLMGAADEEVLDHV